MRPISKAGAEAGYTYVSVLMVLAVMAILAQVTYLPPSSARQRNAEEELIFRGLAYRNAIESYWEAGGELPRLPRTLSDLLNDPRGDGARHIRRLYPDPMSDAPWTLIQGADGGVTGVTSSATDAPRKTAFFGPGLEHFAEAASYAEWTFIFDPSETP